MAKKTFATATDGSTVTFDFDQSKSWQVTLGGNRTAVFTGGQEGDEVTVLVIQDSTGSRQFSWPSNVSFEAQGTPTLRSAASAADLFTFIKRGSTWKERSGGGSRLPSRITDRGLSTVALIGATTALILNLSLGGGEAPGALPNALEVRSNSGAQLNTLINGSGSVLIGSGGLAVGTIKSDLSGATWRITNAGAASGKSLRVGGVGPLNVMCTTTGALVGRCVNAMDANGHCDCR